jgi:hypothetical protein
MALRYYRNGPARALAFPLANGTDTSITVDSASGFPTQYPYTIILDPDQSTEEVCDVTAGAGNVLTLTRGVDGTTAVAHGSGAVVYHGVSARDPREANSHVNATTGVHGAVGGLVDTDSVQSIPGRKIFSDLETVGGGDVVTVGASQTMTGAKTFSALTTMNGGQTVAGAEIHGGTESHAGAETHTGTESHSNTETHTGAESHSGTETHTGTETHSGLLRFSNAVHQPWFANSTADEVTTSTTYTPGGTPVGVSGVVPPSGKLKVTWSAYMSQSTNQNESIVSFALRAGGVIGSGTVLVSTSGDRALVCGMAVNAGAPSRLQASRTTLVVGLTPGDTVNVQIEFQTNPGGGISVFNRELLVEPVL